MKMYHITLLVAALFTGASIAAPSSDFNMSDKMRMAYEVPVVQNASANTMVKTTLQNKKHSHAKLFHKKEKKKSS